MSSGKYLNVFLVFIFGICLSACGTGYTRMTIPSPHYPEGDIRREELKEYVIAYCWGPLDDESFLQSINVVVSSGDERVKTVIESPTDDTGNVQLMLGCFSADGKGILGNGKELSWRPNSDLLAMVKGIDATTTFYQLYNVTDDFEVMEVDLPSSEQYPSYRDPRGIFWTHEGDRFATLGFDLEPMSHANNIWVHDMNLGTSKRISDIYGVGNYLANTTWSQKGDKLAIGYGEPYSGVAIVEYENPENYITITSETYPLLQDWPYILDSAFDLISLAVQKNPLIGFTLYLFSNSTPVWINNDSEIIFIAANSEENAVLFIVNADGSDLREFIPGLPGISGLPTLSPDGKTLAFIRYPKWKNTSRVELALFDLDTSELKSIAVLPEPNNGDQLLISGMNWTSDGKFLAFSSNHEGRSNIYVITKDGERWINLTENMHGDAVSPAWKP